MTRLPSLGASVAIALACAEMLAAVSGSHDISRPVRAAEIAQPAGDPIRGQLVYQACMACHSLDDDDVGPRHRGVVGRRAGAVEDYPYSAALRRSGLVWDAATLDRWLMNPQALVPGAKMFFTLPSARDRADVIAYLAQQH